MKVLLEITAVELTHITSNLKAILSHSSLNIWSFVGRTKCQTSFCWAKKRPFKFKGIKRSCMVHYGSKHRYHGKLEWSRPHPTLFVLRVSSRLRWTSVNKYSLVPIRRHGSINQHISFIWPCTFSNIWGGTINGINTQFWSTSRGTFDKNNFIVYTFCRSVF